MACSVRCHHSVSKEGVWRPCHWRSVRFTLLFLVSVGAIVGVYQFRTLPGVTDEAESDDNSTSARLNATNITNTSTRRPTAVFDINDVITHDRWVVLQPWADVEEPPVTAEDELKNEPRDMREVLACAVVEACVDQGWRPLVLAERVACCSKPRCVLLHAAKRARLPYELRHFFERHNITNMAAQRNLAFLFAIQHGARFVMDWYLEDPLPSDSRAVMEYQKRAIQLLMSATLDVSLGLVLERASDAPLFAVSPRPVRRVYNPHAHFGRPDFWATGFRPPEQRHVSLGLMMSSPRARLVPRWVTESPPRRRSSTNDPSPRQRYRVCELRPPSIEKFLQHPNGGADELDVASPAVVIPGDTLAPASSQISMYSGEALWALALLPSAEHPVPAHLLRTLWAYPLLANIAASVKVSLSPLPAPPLNVGSMNTTRAEAASAGLSSAVLRWRCSSRSILTCVGQLGRDLAPLLGYQAGAFLATWANDLRQLRYLEPPVVPLRRGGLRSPCLGHHGLGGLSYQASPLELPSPLTREEVDRRTRARGRYTEELALLDWIRQLDSSHNNDTGAVADPAMPVGELPPETAVVITELPSLETFMSSSYAGKSSKRDSEQSSIQRETVDGMCLGFSDLLPTRPNRDFTTMLLVVSFSAEKGYDLLPMIEIMYRPHFHNILYCGPAHSSLDIYLHKFQVAENRTLSYLPASASGFECLVGAMEMGYHVDDYLLVASDSLVLPWNMVSLNRTQIWFGSEKIPDEVVTKNQWRDIDPGGQKLPRVMEAVGQALKFIAHILGIHEIGHDDHEDDDDMMPDEESHSPDESKDRIPKPVSNPSHHDEVEPVIPELHLHAEGVTAGDINATTSVYTYETKEDTEPLNKEESLENITSTDPSIVVQESHETSSQHPLIIAEDPEFVMLHDASVSPPSQGGVEESGIQTLPAEETVQNYTTNKTAEDKVIDISFYSESNHKNTTTTEESEKKTEVDVISPSSVPPTINSAILTEDTTEVVTTPESDAKMVEKIISSTAAPVDDRHTIVDEILEEEEPNDYDNPVNHSNADADDTSPIGLQDVASENPSDDALLEYILSSTPTVNTTSELPTASPSNVPNNTTENTHDDIKETVVSLPEETKKSEEVNLPTAFDSEERPGIVVLEEGSVNDKHIPAYHVEGVNDKTELSSDQYNITSFLELDELTDSSLNPVHDTLSSQVAEEIEKSSENGFSKRKAEHEGESKIISKREARLVEDDTPLSAYIDRRMERTFRYIEELIATVVSRLNSTQEMPSAQSFSNNRLDPREFKHLRCYDTGMQAYHSNSELCQSLRQFYMQINEIYNNEGSFKPPYISYPIYHVPAAQQKAFYLLANVFLQFGVPDHVAVPLLVRGLAQKPTQLRRTYFGSDTPATVRPGYPLFDEKSQFLFPVSLQQDLHGDTRFRTVFCLKYLYNMLS